MAVALICAGLLCMVTAIGLAAAQDSRVPTKVQAPE